MTEKRYKINPQTGGIIKKPKPEVMPRRPKPSLGRSVRNLRGDIGRAIDRGTPPNVKKFKKLFFGD